RDAAPFGGEPRPAGRGKGKMLLDPLNQYRIPYTAVCFIYFKNDRCVYLSDVEPVEVKEYVTGGGAEEPEIFLWHYQKDRTLFGRQPILMEGREYFKGLSVHSNCEISFSLDGSFQRFIARIGLADDNITNALTIPARTVRFVVYLDGQKRYESGLLKSGISPRDLILNINGVKELKLVVDDGGDGYILDRAVWALARVVK
ncbi:MAG: NPCBM/NEW2 domain-containing protein, partial [Planctomycetota bacterium]|nr:NPCBM/NEW2 domain-containing protein [Planctomycetota bacterium]